MGFAVMGTGDGGWAGGGRVPFQREWERRRSFLYELIRLGRKLFKIITPKNALFHRHKVALNTRRRTTRRALPERLVTGPPRTGSAGLGSLWSAEGRKPLRAAWR